MDVTVQAGPSESRDVRPITRPVQLLVEGVTPRIFFISLLRNLGLLDLVDIQSFGSTGDLPTFLRLFCKRPDFGHARSLGVVIDAEAKAAEAAFSSVCHSIVASGHDAPGALGQVSVESPRFGVFVLPDNARQGMLEDLCYDSLDLPEVKDCIEKYFECVEAAGQAKPRNMNKARVFAYLATQNLSDPQVGRAAQKGCWDWEHAAFEPLKAFLRALCGEAA